METPKTAFRLAIIPMMLLGLGCGGGDGIKRVTVKGTVTVGKSEPFANGQVVFAPKDPTAKIQGGSAYTNDSGEFVLKHMKGQDGIEPGDYVVSFSKFLMPDGSDPPEDSGEGVEKKEAWEMGAVQFVPAEYSRLDSTSNPVTVGAKSETFEFDIPKLEPQKKGAAPSPAPKQRQRDR